MTMTGAAVARLRAVKPFAQDESLPVDIPCVEINRIIVRDNGS